MGRVFISEITSDEELVNNVPIDVRLEGRVTTIRRRTSCTSLLLFEMPSKTIRDIDATIEATAALSAPPERGR